jgi:hypothetical protein
MTALSFAFAGEHLGKVQHTYAMCNDQDDPRTRHKGTNLHVYSHRFRQFVVMMLLPVYRQYSLALFHYNCNHFYRLMA